MPYIEPDVLKRAREVDLLSYLQANDPGNLVKLSNNSYCTKDHDSLKISNGKWYWFSRKIGGVSAIDYLIKVQNYSLPDAVEAVLGFTSMGTLNHKPNGPRKLLLPEVENEPKRAVEYLSNRGIHLSVINYCIDHALLFETSDYHNVMFVGYDLQGTVRYASLRSTFIRYKGEVTGSDKHFSFSMCANPEAEHVHLFESAIDAMSFASLSVMEGKNWKQDTLLSLAGVFVTKRQEVVPIALSQYLSDHPTVKTLHLHLDNDEVGRGAAARIIDGLAGRYQIFDEPPMDGCKDVNEELQNRMHYRRKEVYER